VFAGALALHAAMLSSLWWGQLDPLFHDADRYPRGIDFYSVYQAGDALLQGRSIYDFPVPAGVVPYAFPYRYLPFVAYALALPLNALPPERAYWAWVVAIEAMVAGNAWLTYRLAPDARWGWIAAAMWYASTPLYLEIYMGQWSLLMATLLFLTAAALAGKERWMAAPAWAVSLVIKTISVLLTPVLVRMREARALAAGAVALVALNAPYFLLRPGDGRKFWDANFRDYWTTPESRLISTSTGNLGLTGFVRSVWLALDERAADTPTWLGLLVVAGVLGVSLLATFRGRAGAEVLVALWLAAYFLVYSDVWEHHYVMLLPALALLVARRPEVRLVAIVVFVLVALPTPYWLFERALSNRPPDARLLAPELYWPEWARVVYHGAKAAPTLALWGVLAGVALLREPEISKGAVLTGVVADEAS
jgi:hypothetical protein